MTPGEGVLTPGTDADVGEVLRQSGQCLRAIDLAAMQALGIAGACVRKPRIRVTRASQGRNDIADAIADWLAYAIAADGGEPVTAHPGGDVEALLTAGEVDADVMIGGTGAGARDNTVHALGKFGTVVAHGIAL